MKKYLLLLTVLTGLVMTGQAQIRTLSYQGILMQNDGITPVTDGEHTILFSFYTGLTGGSAVFTRTLTVTTVKGLFTCIIGGGTGNNAALPPTHFASQQLYVGLRVNGGTELAPRTMLTPAPYAHAVLPNDGGPGPIPVGGIIMWSGAPNQIPQGYALCDGNNGTPDLRGRFIVGYHSGDGDYNSIGKTGGSKRHTLTINEMPSHSHGIEEAGSHRHDFITHAANADILGSEHGFARTTGSWNNRGQAHLGHAGNHTHTINSTGGGQAHENRPPYYTLAFIIKR